MSDEQKSFNILNGSDGTTPAAWAPAEGESLVGGVLS